MNSPKLACAILVLLILASAQVFGQTTADQKSTSRRILNPCASGCVEVIIFAENTGGTYHTYSATSQSTRWDSTFDITTNYETCSVSIDGDQGKSETYPWGWDFLFTPGCMRAGGVIGYSLYKVTVEGKETCFYLDYRDSRYSQGGPYWAIDIWIKYNFATDEWSYNPSGCDDYGWVQIDNGDTVGIWQIHDKGSPSTSAFQPTNPTNLSVTNYNGSPKLTWTPSEPAAATYKVYRNSYCITSTPISNTYYIDNEYSVVSNQSPVYYKVRAVSGDGNKYSVNYSSTVSINAIANQKIEETSGLQLDGSDQIDGVYPNPFNPQTTISFSLPHDTHLHLSVYDLLGRETVRLVDRDLRAGAHEAVWIGEDAQGRPVPSGMYLYRIESAGGTRQGKMLLVR